MWESALLSPSALARGRKAGESSGASMCLEWQVTPGKFLMVTLADGLTGSSSVNIEFVILARIIACALV